MFAALALLIVALPRATPQDELTALIAHYKSLKACTYTIVRHESDDPKIKDLADRIRWSPNHFEINPIPWKESNGNLASKLICDDGRIEVIAPLTGMSEDPLDPGPDRIGAWEGRAGFILVWLMDGKTWKMATQEVPGLNVSYTVGPRTSWHDHEVHEIVLNRTIGPISDSLCLLLSPKDNALVGMEHSQGGATHWEEFLDPVEVPADAK